MTLSRGISTHHSHALNMTKSIEQTEFTETAPRPHPNAWRENGFHHEIIKRRGPVVLVRKTRPGTVWVNGQTIPPSSAESWEVARLRLDRPHTFPNGASYPWRESYPSPEEWGERGWTCTTRELAEQSFIEATEVEALIPEQLGSLLVFNAMQGPQGGTRLL